MAKFAIHDMDLYYNTFHALKNINLELPEHQVSAFIGPSGCGKSTVLRTLDRMHEIIPGAHVKGEVELEGKNLYAKDVDPVAVRRDVVGPEAHAQEVLQQRSHQLAEAQQAAGVQAQGDNEEIQRRGRDQLAQHGEHQPQDSVVQGSVQHG